MSQSEVGKYTLDDDRSRLDFGRVHGWLASSYWSPGISRERVERAARQSALVLGAYLGREQVAYLRVISDGVRFAYLCDVWVDEGHRGHGLGRAMLRRALDHPDLAVDAWFLATKDAHGVYAALGFGPLAEPHRWMTRKPDSPPSSACCAS